jgi:uncharacterized membrane protein
MQRECAMALRTARERLYQTIAYEAGGLAVAAPMYGFVFGIEAGESFGLLMTISLAAMIWAPLYNIFFDWAEFELTGRAASDRPHAMRAAHALCLEISSCAVTVPIVMMMGGHGFWRALAIDLGLTLFYAVYAYGFHVVYDRLRPVSRASRRHTPAHK